MSFTLAKQAYSSYNLKQRQRQRVDSINLVGHFIHAERDECLCQRAQPTGQLALHVAVTVTSQRAVKLTVIQSRYNGTLVASQSQSPTSLLHLPQPANLPAHFPSPPSNGPSLNGAGNSGRAPYVRSLARSLARPSFVLSTQRVPSRSSPGLSGHADAGIGIESRLVMSFATGSVARSSRDGRFLAVPIALVGSVGSEWTDGCMHSSWTRARKVNRSTDG